MCIRHSQRGVSLIELIMFIVIVSVALAGILLVMNVTTRGSVDPLIHKQSLAIAESLLEEVELMPFTICDPDDANAETAVTAADCAATSEALGPETIGGVKETRYGTGSANAGFDNVNDYNGFTMNAGTGGIVDITGLNPVAALSGYSASVAVSAASLGGITAASGDALLISVTVTGPDGLPVAVEGMRARYAPRTLP
jgi:MSHA pilin protein MshD